MTPPPKKDEGEEEGKGRLGIYKEGYEHCLAEHIATGNIASGSMHAGDRGGI